VNLVEPETIKNLNKKMISQLGFFMPGNANKWLCGAIFGIKPLQVKHLKELNKEDIREYWLNKSDSNMKEFIRSQWDNIATIVSHRNVI